MNISSIDGFYVAPFTGAYAGSEVRVCAASAKVAALELGGAGIRVNCVCPAAGNPDMVRETLPEALQRPPRAAIPTAASRRPPVGRHGTVDDVAVGGRCTWRRDESGYVTGTELLLDGGETAGWNLMRRMRADGQASSRSPASLVVTSMYSSTISKTTCLVVRTLFMRLTIWPTGMPTSSRGAWPPILRLA